MKDLKKAAIASFVVQLALVLVGTILYWLPAQLGQSGVVALFPFVLGVQLGPLLLRPLTTVLSPDFSLKLAILSALLSNFVVYATIFYLWFMLRKKFSPLAPSPALT